MSPSASQIQHATKSDVQPDYVVALHVTVANAHICYYVSGNNMIIVYYCMYAHRYRLCSPERRVAGIQYTYKAVAKPRLSNHNITFWPSNELHTTQKRHTHVLFQHAVVLYHLKGLFCFCHRSLQEPGISPAGLKLLSSSFQ